MGTIFEKQCFFNLFRSWRFLKSYMLEKLKLKLEEIIWVQKSPEKVIKKYFLTFPACF